MAKRHRSNIEGPPRQPFPVPSFFKIMIGPFKTTLYIPPKAARGLEKLVNCGAFLEDSNGKCWEVQVSSVDNSLAFCQGWNQFVSDHNIVDGEFIIFRYNGKQKFSLQIYGLSGCERHFFYKQDNHSNDLSQIKRRPSINPQATEIDKGLNAVNVLTQPKTSVVCGNQPHHFKTASDRDNPRSCKSKRPNTTVSRQKKFDKEVAEKSHSTHAKKKMKVSSQEGALQPAFDTGGHEICKDALENLQASVAEGFRFLVNEDGICFLDGDDSDLLSPLISTDTARRNVESVINPEVAMVPQVPSSLNCNDNYAAVQDSPINTVHDSVLRNAPDMLHMDNVEISPESPKAVLHEKSLDMILSRTAPLRCTRSSKHVGEPEPLPLAAPVKMSFSISDNIHRYQELPSSLSHKKIGVDRKIVLLRNDSQTVWPVLYIEDPSAQFTGFYSGWKTFTFSNKIKGGDRCELELKNEADDLYDVRISSV